MNIFYLDKDPELCAKYHVDKHIVKMPIEYAQMLSTAHRVCDGYQILEKSKTGRSKTTWKMYTELDQKLYKATHVNHPCAEWVRKSHENYTFLYNLLVQCLAEYTNRYKKIHKTSELLTDLNELPFNLFEKGSFTEPPKCMPELYQKETTVDSYRNFYIAGKTNILNWKTTTPEWIKEMIDAG